MIKSIEPSGNKKPGWIKMYRSIKDHWLWPKNRPMTEFEAWIAILIEVNHSGEKVKIGNDIYDCQRGEKLYSLDTWARLFNWNKSKVRRFFELLKTDAMIELKSEHKTTRLIICNYESYQDSQNDDETEMKRKRNVDDTNIRMNKNDKEIYIGKIQKEFYQSLIPFLKEFGKQTIRDFYDYWSEPNKSKTKIRYQIEKTWDTHKRLLRWAKNDFKSKSLDTAKEKVQQKVEFEKNW
ncbi:MAG: hypothetical protein AB2L20_11740 [Mangrovibacterium sp.]